MKKNIYFLVGMFHSEHCVRGAAMMTTQAKR